MSAATCPTSFLSTPWIVIFVLSATVILMSLGIENGTGCEKPRLKLRIDPCTAALKPTPSISSCFVKPSLTPCTILCTRLRESPCSRSEEHTSELQSQSNLVCRLLLEKISVLER